MGIGSPSTLWVPGIEPRLSGLAVSTFTHGVSCLAYWKLCFWHSAERIHCQQTGAEEMFHVPWAQEHRMKISLQTSKEIRMFSSLKERWLKPNWTTYCFSGAYVRNRCLIIIPWRRKQNEVHANHCQILPSICSSIML